MAVVSGRREWSGARTLAAAVALLLSCAACAQEAEPDHAAERSETAVPASDDGGSVYDDGLIYPVRELRLRYFRDHPSHPSLNELLDLEVQLCVVEGAFAAPRHGVESLTLRIADVGRGDVVEIYGSGIGTIAQRVFEAFRARGLIGVVVAPSEDEIDRETEEDLREPGDEALTLDIYTGIVVQVRSIASGTRFPKEQRLNNPAHARIRDNSPVQPWRPEHAEAAEDDPSAEQPRGDLIRRDLLDAYTLRLNRHPGRRVDVAIAPAFETGEAALDYLVAESRPLSAYFQLSNTGTKETDTWRQRFGLIHNQLTNNDDVLTVEYITAGFSQAHAFVGSYEAPLGSLERVRWRVFGSYSRFTASDVGRAGERFTGEGWTAGGEVIFIVFQQRELFIDLFGGARWENIEVNNEVVAIQGREDFFIPRFGARAERRGEEWTIESQLAVEFSMSDVSGAGADEMTKLGRLAPDDDWVVLQGSLGASLFLEPLIAPRDRERPRTLAHEIALNVRAQYAFDNRLIPNAEQVAGGLYSVRGYPESITAGDTVVIASAEYRFHVPRAFEIEEEPRSLLGRSFRFAPQQAYGRPDWDLILRGFVDAARVVNSDRQAFERDEDMLGAGVGVELLLYRNVSVRMDWAAAIEEIEGKVKSGSNRFHFVFTFLF
ncbi:MAG: ShlB/FhaC/HecB family hemolysin secretion/activation protein [Phycisphaeraceae bacterium]|nr:ShlB/FhaC/HecB family hemolysin secretion/activation protein [Phycisphaeraceae bacterium]